MLSGVSWTGAMQSGQIHQARSKRLKNYGNVVIVPQFGKVYFGEVIMKNGLRHVTMLRFELGSPLGGSCTMASGSGNGSTWP